MKLNTELIQEKKSLLIAILEKYHFHNLNDYSINPQNTNRLDTLYQDILINLLNKNTTVSGKEVSEGKYIINIKIECFSYRILSKVTYSKKDILDNLMVFVITPYLINSSSHK